jgi:hypothetical protein
VFGDLRIVASADLGGAGRQESDPVLYHWAWYRHLPRLGPWLLLLLAIVLPRANRDAGALLIFIPLLVLSLLWRPLAKSMGWSSLGLEEYGLVFESLVLGVALLWLSVPKLSKYAGFERFVLSMGAILVGALVAGVSSGGGLSGETAPFLLTATVMGVVLLLALTATRGRARRRYDPLRFMLWLALWSVLFSMLGTILLAPLLLVFKSRFGLIGLLLPGLMLGLWLYAINLPYMLLLFSSPFFRRRFCTWLGVEPLPQQTTEVPGMSES